MTATHSFVSAVDDLIVIRIYGKKAIDLSLTSGKESKLAKEYGAKGVSFAWLYGARVLGLCQQFPKPVLVLVPDSDEDPEGCEQFSDPKVYRMWTLPKGSPLVRVTHEVVQVEQIALSGLEVQADFHFHDIQLNGTVLSGKLRSYLHLRLGGPFGSTIFDITVIDRDDTLSFDFNQIPCITVFTIAGVASAQVCFHANPNRICGEVVVGIDLPVIGHWGQTFTIACVNL
jgi:hypothetical protein